jgi:hypothetical protein
VKTIAIAPFALADAVLSYEEMRALRSKLAEVTKVGA